VSCSILTLGISHLTSIYELFHAVAFPRLIVNQNIYAPPKLWYDAKMHSEIIVAKDPGIISIVKLKDMRYELTLKCFWELFCLLTPHSYFRFSRCSTFLDLLTASWTSFLFSTVTPTIPNPPLARLMRARPRSRSFRRATCSSTSSESESASASIESCSCLSAGDGWLCRFCR
jgi:hypothetical protein